METFTLMNKNKKIFDFEYDTDYHMLSNVYRNYKDNEKYAPLGMIKNDEVDKNAFNKWWKNRQIPASRNNLKEVLKNLNIYDSDNFDLLESKAYCLSLSDQYWVKRINDNITWDEINFFDNSFSEDIGKILFNGGKTTDELSLNTPDMTSNGNYEKRWKIINGKRFLIKAGNKILNQEPFNEVIATKLYQRILNEDEYVKYELATENNRTVSICENFITKDTELIPAWKIMECFDIKCKNKYEHYIKSLEKLNIKNARLLIDKMITCDYILANKDRHCNNFGVIRNVNTLKFERICPIYDNGCSLWYDENDIYVGEFFLTKPFLEHEVMQLDLVKDFDWLDISLLDGFDKEVKDILSKNNLISKTRIDKIINEINKRIEYIKDLKNAK